MRCERERSWQEYERRQNHPIVFPQLTPFHPFYPSSSSPPRLLSPPPPLPLPPLPLNSKPRRSNLLPLPAHLQPHLRPVLCPPRRLHRRPLKLLHLQNPPSPPPPRCLSRPPLNLPNQWNTLEPADNRVVDSTPYRTRAALRDVLAPGFEPRWVRCAYHQQ